MKHFYKSQPNRAFWSRAVSEGWNPRDLLTSDQVLLRKRDKIASAGSCFAANLVPYLKKNGFNYIEAEKRHPIFGSAPVDNFSYDKFSAAYGNIYTTRQFLQLLNRTQGTFKPREDRWQVGNEVVDPFRPGMIYRARSNQEFDLLTQSHLARVRSVFETATVVIFTLGLTEAWMSKADGAVFPACPGTVAGTFDPSKHVMHNFTVAEILDDLEQIYEILKKMRPDVRMILTVSPVPLVATATKEHVLTASTYSKSVLRVACGEFVRNISDVEYFPSYEIITGPQAPKDFYEADRRNASKKGVDSVMDTFLGFCEIDGAVREESSKNATATASKMSEIVGNVDCEEAASDI